MREFRWEHLRPSAKSAVNIYIWLRTGILRTCRSLFGKWRTVIFALLAVGFSFTAAQIQFQAFSDAWAEQKVSMEAYPEAKQSAEDKQDWERYHSISQLEGFIEPKVEMGEFTLRVLGIGAFLALSIDMLLNKKARTWFSITVWVLWTLANLFSGLAD